jgi:hypothetical protein
MLYYINIQNVMNKYIRKQKMYTIINYVEKIKSIHSDNVCAKHDKKSGT